MLLAKTRTAADYRVQAAHIREFLETVHDDDQLRTVLLDAAARLDRLAAEADHWESITIGEKAAAKPRAEGRRKQTKFRNHEPQEIEVPCQA